MSAVMEEWSESTIESYNPLLIFFAFSLSIFFVISLYYNPYFSFFLFFALSFAFPYFT